MVRIEDHCCDCAVPGYPCLGNACERRHVEVHYCDRCDPNCVQPLHEVYEADGEELCEDCYEKLYGEEE